MNNIWSHIPDIAILSDTSDIPQNDIGNHLGLYITVVLRLFPSIEGLGRSKKPGQHRLCSVRGDSYSG